MSHLQSLLDSFRGAFTITDPRPELICAQKKARLASIDLQIIMQAIEAEAARSTMHDVFRALGDAAMAAKPSRTFSDGSHLITHHVNGIERTVVLHEKDGKKVHITSLTPSPQVEQFIITSGEESDRITRRFEFHETSQPAGIHLQVGSNAVNLWAEAGVRSVEHFATVAGRLGNLTLQAA